MRYRSAVQHYCLMPQKTQLSNNPWFLLPFLIWMIAGGVLLATIDAAEVFTAVNTGHSAALDFIMFWITHLGERIPMIVIVAIVFFIPGFRNWWFVLAAVLCNLVPAAITQGLKDVYHSPRPQAVFEGETWLRVLEHWDVLYERSFPSGHTTSAFSLFCFLSLLLPRRWAPLGLVFFIIALAVGYSRMYLAAHFFKDVYVGSLIGAMGALLMYRLERDLHGRFYRTKESEKTKP